MVFSSLLFLYAFLPLFLVLYHATPTRFRNYTALLGSAVFYAWGAPKFFFVLFAGTLVDYIISRRMVVRPDDTRHKKILLAVSLALNLGLLFFFKYANFFVREMNDLLATLGMDNVAWTAIVLPLGISFFTFQKVSYVVDVYRGTTKPANDFLTCLLYISLFPQLIAGPIVRYHDIADQLVQRTHSREKFARGIWRLSLGLGKKVLIANVLGEVCDTLFSTSVTQLSPAHAWIGVLAFTFQVYFDFSGYSDMAIGLARMMGFELLENFNKPFISRSITELWTRWHISLSNFMREYLYIPLGGNRVSKPRNLFNLWVVFLLSGLWHGADWQFIVFGAYNGLFITLDKLFWLKTVKKLPKIVTVPLTFLIFLLGLVIFRADSMPYAGQYLLRMFNLTRLLEPSDILWAEVVSHRAWAAFVVAALISFVPAFALFGRSVEKAGERLGPKVIVGLQCVTSMILFFLSVCSLANLNFNPFIYFRF